MKLHFTSPNEDEFIELLKLMNCTNAEEHYDEFTKTAIALMKQNFHYKTYSAVVDLYLYIYFYTGTMNVVQQIQFIRAMTGADMNITYTMYPLFRDVVKGTANVLRAVRSDPRGKAMIGKRYEDVQL